MFTFSKIGQNKTNGFQDVKKTVITSDLIQQVENCKNFSKLYSLSNKPEADINAGKIKSVIFKTTEFSATHLVNFEFWTKEDGRATYYELAISTRFNEVDSIRDSYGYTVRSSSFRINEQNEAEIAIYGAPRL